MKASPALIAFLRFHMTRGEYDTTGVNITTATVRSAERRGLTGATGRDGFAEVTAEGRAIADYPDPIAAADATAAVDDALASIISHAPVRRRAIAAQIARAVVAAHTDHGDMILASLASEVPTSERGELVHRLYTDMHKRILPSILERGVKVAAAALTPAKTPASSAKAAGATVRTPVSIAALGLARTEDGKYRHPSGAVIERRPAVRLGRNGFAYAGWAVIVDGREINRWSTLALAAEKETARVLGQA